jgi:hypothetical protein
MRPEMGNLSKKYAGSIIYPRQLFIAGEKNTGA